jgi:signal transduction histidine kinase
MNKISLSEKLILYFLTLGFGAIAIISVFAFFSTKHALMNRTFDQLTSLRIVKKHQLELFFDDRIRDLTFLASSGETKEIAGAMEVLVKEDHLKESDSEKLLSQFSLYLNKYRSLNIYFKTLCIKGKNDFMLEGNLEKGTIRIIHPTGKYPDLNALGETLKKQKLFIEDEVQPEKSESPTLLISTIITRNRTVDSVVGFLLMKIPVEAINAIMLNNNPESGLGKSGETYLVGNNHLMRSSSRFIPNSILKTKVNTKSASNAFQGVEGSMITQDYRGIPVLSSYSKVIIPGLDWIILSEIDQKEAMIPIYRMRNSILFLGIFISLIFFGFAFLIARKISRPIIHLKDAADKIGKGEYDIQLPIETQDEIGSLTGAFNNMTIQIRDKTRELQHERVGRIRSVIDGEESERQRLSRELHDGIGQSLVALKLRLESLLYIDEKNIKENIIVLKDQVDDTVDEIRRISNNLMPSVLEVFGITIALKNLCSETGEHAGIKIDFECHGDLEMMNKKLKTYLYRISQEALNNIVKHSGASELALKISREEDQITLHIKDNGKGFVLEEAAMERGNGLYNMRERVNLLHGTFEIKSFINKGTDIIVQLPVF